MRTSKITSWTLALIALAVTNTINAQDNTKFPVVLLSEPVDKADPSRGYAGYSRETTDKIYLEAMETLRETVSPVMEVPIATNNLGGKFQVEPEGISDFIDSGTMKIHTASEKHPEAVAIVVMAGWGDLGRSNRATDEHYLIKRLLAQLKAFRQPIFLVHPFNAPVMRDNRFEIELAKLSGGKVVSLNELPNALAKAALDRKNNPPDLSYKAPPLSQKPQVLTNLPPRDNSGEIKIIGQTIPTQK